MANDALLSLARIRTEVLESVWRALDALPPKARVAETDVDDEEARAAIEALLGQPAWLVCALLEAVLSERGTFTTVAVEVDSSTPSLLEYRIERRFGTSSPELVWSGDTGARSCARETRYVIEDLFASVRSAVLIAGYSFDHATELFAPLFLRVARQRDRGEPEPTVRVVLDCSRTPTQGGDRPEDIARRTGERFLKMCWSDRSLVPRLQYYRPSAQRAANGFATYSMHAKCIIVDAEVALVGSANFSTRGRDNRSLEVGALVRDYHFVQSLLAAWRDVDEQLEDLPGWDGGDLAARRS